MIKKPNTPQKETNGALQIKNRKKNQKRIAENLKVLKSVEAK